MTDPRSLPYLHGTPQGRALFKVEPGDFLVEEQLGFEPSGDGEHCLLWVEKCDIDSNTASTMLADALGIRRRLVSHCGLKDRHAITRQWFSVHLPGADSPDAEALTSENLRVLRVTRNLRKLRRGTHIGNRFTIRLRDVAGVTEAQARQRWQDICVRGVPNYFGPQRFGREGRNVEKAQAMFRGDFAVRDRFLRGILLSAARSHLFNSVIAARVVSGNWDTPLDGEVFGFTDNRSLILPERQRGDEAARFADGTLELTAPLWGNGELQSIGEVLSLEQGCIANCPPELAEGLADTGLRQERRVTRLHPIDPKIEFPTADVVELSFDLPKGTYATTLLREWIELVEQDHRLPTAED